MIVAPALATAAAIAERLLPRPRPSTVPPSAASWSLPIAQRPTVITVSCGWNARLTSLNETGIFADLGDTRPAARGLPVDRHAVADRAEADLTLVLGAVNRQSEHAQARGNARPRRLRSRPSRSRTEHRLALPGNQKSHAGAAWARSHIEMKVQPPDAGSRPRQAWSYAGANPRSRSERITANPHRNEAARLASGHDTVKLESVSSCIGPVGLSARKRHPIIGS